VLLPDTQDQQIDLNAFAILLLEGAYRTVQQAVEGLTDEQLYRQPSPDTNSVGWLAWHMSRWMDQFAARALGEEQIWILQDWPGRFDVDPERTGQGDSLEQVAAFRPSREILLGYVNAAYQSTIERIARITPERLLQDASYAKGREPRPVWRSLIGTIADASQHAGQIAYLRGLISGYGWRSF